jgi:hypothetical protein
MSDLNRPNYQILTRIIDYQNSHFLNSHIGLLHPPNLNDKTNLSILNLNFRTTFPMVYLDKSQNLQIYQPNYQCMSLQQNNIIPSNQYMPNMNLPNMNISNPHLVN